MLRFSATAAADDLMDETNLPQCKSARVNHPSNFSVSVDTHLQTKQVERLPHTFQVRAGIIERQSMYSVDCNFNQIFGAAVNIEDNQNTMNVQFIYGTSFEL